MSARRARPATPPPLSAPIEDYLKAIYALGREGSAAGTSEIAARLAVAPPSVSGMVRRLAEQGLVAHEPYHGVRLTALGRHAALRTIRRHRVVETYLAQALGVPWDRLHEEAERLEHAVSDDLVDRMAAALGEPAHDPHGHPIPTRDGAIDETPHPTLADLARGQRGRVVGVSDADAGLLRDLARLGLRPGVDVRRDARPARDGRLTLHVGDATCVVGGAVAASVHVVPIPD